MDPTKKAIRILKKELDAWKKTYETVTDPGLRESLHLEFMKKVNMLLDLRKELPKKKEKVRENYVKYD